MRVVDLKRDTTVTDRDRMHGHQFVELLRRQQANHATLRQFGIVQSNDNDSMQYRFEESSLLIEPQFPVVRTLEAVRHRSLTSTFMIKRAKIQRPFLVESLSVNPVDLQGNHLAVIGYSPVVDISYRYGLADQYQRYKYGVDLGQHVVAIVRNKLDIL